jgi:probable F420-dependent oxidoreductase
MTQVAAEVADGMLVHPFTTERYLRQVTLPTIEGALDGSGRGRSDFQLAYQAMVVTGRSEQELARAATAVRRQIAFYGSTPAYRPVLDLHGWGDLQLELNRLSKQGEWSQMGELIDDEILHSVAVVGEPSAVGAELAVRFGDLIDRLSFYLPGSLADDDMAVLVAGVRPPA